MVLHGYTSHCHDITKQEVIIDQSLFSNADYGNYYCSQKCDERSGGWEGGIGEKSTLCFKIQTVQTI